MDIKDPRYKSLVEDFSNDPEFLDFSPEEQDSILDTAVQNKYGKIPNTQNFLQNAISNVGPNITNFGPAGALSGVKNSEDILPDINQFGGNIAGGEVGLQTMGHPNLGAAIGGSIGRPLGELERQTEKKLFRGNNFDISEVGKQAKLGSISEAVTLPFASAGTRFLSGPAGKEFKNKIGSVLGSVIDKIDKSGVKTSISKVVDPIFEAVDHIRKNFEVDPSISKFLEDTGFEAYDTAQKKGGSLEVNDLKNIKSRLDKFLESIGVYGNKVKGKGKGAYNAVEDVMSARSSVGDSIQEMANKVGEGKTYNTAKNSYAKVARTYPASGKHGLLKSFMEAGSIRDLMSGNLPGAAGQMLASEAVGSNKLLNFIFNAGKVGKAVPTGIAEYLNNFVFPKE